MIDITKPVETTDGRPVKIKSGKSLCKEWPITAVLDGIYVFYTGNGEFMGEGHKHPNDIRNIPDSPTGADTGRP